MNMQEAIRAVTEGRDLTMDEMTEVMHLIMGGRSTPAQTGGFLVGLRMKGETIDELTAATRVMRELAARVTVDAAHLVDTCGTGGDAMGTFNISTTCAFVAAAAGARVAKHGNRSASGRCGSADVLEALGVRLDLGPEQVARCIREVGVGFMFAPAHHGAMKHAIGPRREMGVRTIFNLLGPMTNPANAPNQVIGVFSDRWLDPMAEALGRLGSRHVLVVHGEDGMDEISITAPTRVAELKQGSVATYTLTPEQFGLKRGTLADLVADDIPASVAMLTRVLDNTPGAPRDIVALNAGAAIHTAGVAETMEDGIRLAQAAIADGSARACLEAFKVLTNQLASTA